MSFILIVKWSSFNLSLSLQVYPPAGRAESAEGDGREGVLSPAGSGRGGPSPPLLPASLSAGDSPPQTAPPGQRSWEETLQETSGALPGHHLLWSCESPSLYLYFKLLLCVAELSKRCLFPSSLHSLIPKQFIPVAKAGKRCMNNMHVHLPTKLLTNNTSLAICLIKHFRD